MNMFVTINRANELYHNLSVLQQQSWTWMRLWVYNQLYSTGMCQISYLSSSNSQFHFTLAYHSLNQSISFEMWSIEWRTWRCWSCFECFEIWGSAKKQDKMWEIVHWVEDCWIKLFGMAQMVMHVDISTLHKLTDSFCGWTNHQRQILEIVVRNVEWGVINLPASWKWSDHFSSLYSSDMGCKKDRSNDCRWMVWITHWPIIFLYFLAARGTSKSPKPRLLDHPTMIEHRC